MKKIGLTVLLLCMFLVTVSSDNVQIVSASAKISRVRIPVCLAEDTLFAIRNSEIVEITGHDTFVTLTEDVPFPVDQLDVSSDGCQILFTGITEYGSRDIFVGDLLTGRGLKYYNITNTPFIDDTNPRWASSGDILWLSYSQGPLNLNHRDLEGNISVLDTGYFEGLDVLEDLAVVTVWDTLKFYGIHTGNTAEGFYNPSLYKDVRFSPDGRYVAAILVDGSLYAAGWVPPLHLAHLDSLGWASNGYYAVIEVDGNLYITDTGFNQLSPLTTVGGFNNPEVWTVQKAQLNMPVGFRVLR